MQVRPLSPDRIVEELAAAIDAAGSRDTATTVLVDGAPPTCPDAWADALVEPLRLAGRPVVRVSARDYLRPASLRHERGRDDPDVMYEDWLDTSALVREVLAPLRPGGTGQILPALWDADADRAYRSSYVEVPFAGVIVLSGSLLLGCLPPVDVTVHLALSRAALARRTPTDEQWTLPAYERYEEEVEPARTADHVALLDNPERPAVRIDVGS
jgi:hypothetical protein